MFDATGAFNRQFIPVEGGYLYYPSPKAGGKLITADEHERLVADWQSVAGRGGQWKTVGLVLVFILFWTLLSEAMTLPEWADGIMTGICVIGVMSWLLWASWAPRQLVNGRPDISPPRPAPEARRHARALINWRMVIFVLLFSSVAFLGTLSSPERTLNRYAWLIASGALFAGYVCIAMEKLVDRQH